jgi:hypothetical protein
VHAQKAELLLQKLADEEAVRSLGDTGDPFKVIQVLA